MRACCCAPRFACQRRTPTAATPTAEAAAEAAEAATRYVLCPQQRWLPLALPLPLSRGPGAQSNVVELTSTNFDELVGQDKAVVMDFYAPWW